LPIIITPLSATINKTDPIKEEQYTEIVSKAANWIKAREDQYQFVNYSKTKDSLEFDITEKLLLRSLLQNYQLRKELLNAKLATINSEKEALDYLNSSKEWKEVLQYENWAGAYLKKHPELSITDSLRRF
jgi:arsenate reductase-like glutaredoxin family protein